MYAAPQSSQSASSVPHVRQNRPVTDGRDVFVEELIAALQRFGKPVG